MDLTSESDLFFHYSLVVNHNDFHLLKKSQGLTVKFPNFSDLLVKLFANVLRNPHSYFIIIQLFQDNSAKLDFIQNLEYKYIGQPNSLKRLFFNSIILFFE